MVRFVYVIYNLLIILVDLKYQSPVREKFSLVLLYEKGNGLKYKPCQSWYDTRARNRTALPPTLGAWGRVVVKALRYKSDGPGMCQSLGIFSVVPSDKTMCPEVDSASENEYQGFLLG